MEPAFCEGDHVLTFNWRKFKAGDVVVFVLPSRHPESRWAGRRIYEKTLLFARSGKTENNRHTYWIKRIKKVSGERCYVEGDNKKISSIVGPIEKVDIVGKVILKY